MTRCRPKLVLALGTVRLAGPALACDRCLPGPWSGPTDPTMLPSRIRSIRPGPALQREWGAGMAGQLELSVRVDYLRGPNGSGSDTNR